MSATEADTAMNVTGAAGTRQRIIDAALSIFAERGYSSAALADIARSADVSTGAIYGHFRNKAELLAAALHAAIRQPIEDEIITRPSPSDARTTELWIDPSLAWVRSLHLEAAVAARRDPTLRAALAALHAERDERIGAILDEARQRGLVDLETDTETLALVLRLIDHGVAVAEASGDDLPDPERWVQTMQRLFSGLRGHERADGEEHA